MPSVQAFVLRKTQHGEADLLLALFTREMGKVMAYARHARKSRKRFGGSLEPFCLLSVELRSRPGAMPLALEADLIRAFPSFSTDLDLFAWGGFMLETVDILLPDDDPEPGMFDLVMTTLERLDKGERAPGGLRGDIQAFMLRALEIAGYSPRFPVDTEDFERAPENIKLLTEFTERHTTRQYKSKKIVERLLST